MNVVLTRPARDGQGNAIVRADLVAALASAWLLRRRGLTTTLIAAFVILGGACFLLIDPTRAAVASFLYPAGGSLYSVAFVAYPAFLGNPASTRASAKAIQRRSS